MRQRPSPTPGLADVEAAGTRIAGAVQRTPVLALAGEELGVPGMIALKLESLQHTGSFKARGALNSIAALQHRPAGVVAASGGNHGAAVAWAARRAGLPADVFVPATSPATKVDRIRSYGARVHVVDGYYPAALAAAQAWAAGRDVERIHAYDGFHTVCGQGTVGLEVADQVPDADRVVVACGGGGLFAGVATALARRCVVLPVEPERCANLHAALAAGRPVDIDVGGVAADSLGAAHIGSYALAIARSTGVEPALVSDEDIITARRWLWEHSRILAEPGACAGLAAVMTGAVPVRPGERTVVVVSGGNTAALP